MPSAGAAHAPSPLLTIEPASALLDEPVDIRLTGLVPGARVTLTATMTDHLDRGGSRRQRSPPMMQVSSMSLPRRQSPAATTGWSRWASFGP